MRELRLLPACVGLWLLAGCAPAPVAPVEVAVPEPSALEPLSGRLVALEGRVELRKAGLVLVTSGPPVILEYRGAEDATWPKPGGRVRATGILRVTGTGEGRFRLEHPRSSPASVPSG